MTTPAYYSILTARVRYAPISPAAKIMFSEITALSQAGGFCWAGNGYFSELYQVTDRQVRRWLRELQLLQAIRVETVDGRRRIFVLDDPAGLAGRTKMSGGPDKNVRGGRTKMSGNPDKNVRHNNINNNTSINSAKKTDQRKGTGPDSSGSATDLLERLKHVATPNTFAQIAAAHIAGTRQFRDEGLTELSRGLIAGFGGEIISAKAKRHNTGKGGAA